MRAMVWEVHEGVEVEDRGYKKRRLQGNFGHSKNAFGRMGRRVIRKRPSKENKDIVCGVGGGDYILWRPKGRGIISLITEGDN